MTTEEIAGASPVGGDLREQLAATLYEVVDDQPWESVSDEDRAETVRIVAPLVSLFADWLTGIANLELLIAHQRTEVGCLCGWAELGEHHSEHVLTMLAGSLGGES